MSTMAHAALSDDAGAWPPGDGERRVAFAAMTPADLPAVVALEQSAYAHPWTQRHFSDTLAAGHEARMLVTEALPGEAGPRLPDGRVLLGYVVAMKVIDEVHLLNITVAPAHQRRGWARFMLEALVTWSRGHSAQWLWLEVRRSNAPARALYIAKGFKEVGVRRHYYPNGRAEREDAIVMSRPLWAAPTPEAAA